MIIHEKSRLGADEFEKLKISLPNLFFSVSRATKCHRENSFHFSRELHRTKNVNKQVNKIIGRDPTTLTTTTNNNFIETSYFVFKVVGYFIPVCVLFVFLRIFYNGVWKMWEKARPSDNARPLEVGRSEHGRKRRKEGGREQSVDYESQQVQPIHCQVRDLQDMQAESPPGGLPLLPVVRLQEGHLRHVWNQTPWHEKLQTVLRLKSVCGI